MIYTIRCRWWFPLIKIIGIESHIFHRRSCRPLHRISRINFYSILFVKYISCFCCRINCYFTSCHRKRFLIRFSFCRQFINRYLSYISPGFRKCPGTWTSIFIIMINLTLLIIILFPWNENLISFGNFFTVQRNNINVIHDLSYYFVTISQNCPRFAFILHQRILCKELSRKYFAIKCIQRIIHTCCIISLWRLLPTVNTSTTFACSACIAAVVSRLYSSEQSCSLENIRLVVLYKTNQISCSFKVACPGLNTMDKYTVGNHFIRILCSKNNVAAFYILY